MIDLIYDHNMKPRALMLRKVKGCLEVKAIRHTQIGAQEGVYIASGSIGYVLASRGDGQWLVAWPHINSEDANPYGTISSHNRDDLQPTGKRG